MGVVSADGGALETVSIVVQILVMVLFEGIKLHLLAHQRAPKPLL